MWRTTPAGRRSLVVFSLGTVTGAGCTLAGLWLLSGLFAPLPTQLRVGALLAIGLAAVARDRGLLRLPLPQAARQIPRDVLQRGPVAGAFQFGFELGTCVRTYVTGSAPYVVAAAVLLLGPPPGLLVAAAVGVAVGRTLPVVQALGTDHEGFFAAMTDAQRPLVTTTAALTLACLAVVGLHELGV